MKITYSPESINDLQRLREFIAVKNPNTTRRIALSLLESINKLKLFSYVGIEVKAANSEFIRDLIVGDYIVRYLILNESIYIIRVWHHKEDWK